MEINLIKRNETNNILCFLSLSPFLLFILRLHTFLLSPQLSFPHRTVLYLIFLFLSALKKKHKYSLIDISSYQSRLYLSQIKCTQARQINDAGPKINTIYSYVSSKHVGGNMNGAMPSALTLSCVCMWGGGMNGRSVFVKSWNVIGRNGFNGLFFLLLRLRFRVF